MSKVYVVKHCVVAYRGGPGGWTTKQSEAQKFTSLQEALAAKDPSWTCCKVVRLRRKATGYVVRRGGPGKGFSLDSGAGYVAKTGDQANGGTFRSGVPVVFRGEGARAHAFRLRGEGLGYPYRRVIRVVRKKAAR